FLLLSSVAFDSSIAGIFWSLLSGGVLVLTSELSTDAAVAAIANHNVNSFLAVPSLYGVMLDQIEYLQTELRLAIIAGESCSSDLVERHYRSFSSIPLVNEYGPTECSVWSTAHFFAAGERFLNGVPIGRPLPNYRVYVLDALLEAVPSGVAGELYVAGL